MTRIDIKENKYLKKRYVESLKEGNFKESKETVIKKAKKMTFDDLWDWRLHQGNRFIGKEMKETLAVFGQASQQGGSPERPLLQTAREAKASGIEMPSKKESIDTDNEEDEDQGNDEQRKLKKQYKKNIEDLEKWAALGSEQITKEVEKKNRIKPQDKVAGFIGSFIQKQTQVDEYNKRKERAKAKEENVYQFHDNKDSFEVSDDEDLTIKKSARERNNLKNKRLNDEIKADEDFKKIGDAIIGQSELVKRNLQVQNPKDKSEKTVFDNFFGGSANNVADTPAIKVSLKTSQEKDQVAKETEKDKKDKKEKEEDKKGKDGKKDDKKNEKDKEKEDNANAEAETEKLHLILQKNPAFKAIQKIMTNENNILEKMGMNRKKKKRNDDEEKVSPEEQLEEKIAKYYQKKNYDYLKLEPGFIYDVIPPPAFNSILDILPNMVKNANQEALNARISEQQNIRLRMNYTMSELKKKKQKKKKSKADREKEANIKRQSQMQASINMGASTANAGSSGMRSSLANDSDVSMSSMEEHSQDEQSNKDRDKGSQAKKSRKKFFEENEKFIKKKPFPLMEGKRKNKILSAMTDPTGNFEKPLDKVRETATATTGRSRMRGMGVDANIEDIQGFSERYRKDYDDDYKEEESQKLRDSHYDYELLYLNIRSADNNEDSIEKFNWSGNEIMNSVEFSLSQTEKSIDSLNVQKHDIWLSGCKGFFETTRRYSRELIDSKSVNSFLMLSVFLNTLILGADGLAPTDWDDYFTTMNLVFTFIFVAELVFKVYGLGPKRYVKDAFNVFDAFVVALSIVELIINSLSSGSGGGATSGFRAVRIFRIFRVLRVTRLLRSLRFMRVIIEVMKNTAEQFGYMVLLMFLFIFIFTLLGTQIFGGSFDFNQYPHNPQRYNFDSFSAAFFTVFTILTVENWNGILTNCLRSSANNVLAVFYLIIWIFIGNYIFVNLFLSILLDGFESTDAMQQIDEIEHETKELERSHKRLIDKNEKKKILDQAEKEKAIEQVQFIIDPENNRSKQKIKKNQAAYLVQRDSELDNPSLSEDLNVEKICKNLQKGKKIKTDPYEGVDCVKSLYYFNQKNPIRLLSARVVSHPW
jgi:hypothetical protein